MARLIRFAGFMFATTLIVVGCTSSGATAAPTSAPPAAPSAAASASASAGAAGLSVGMATTSLGAILTGPNGLTLYVHAGDGMNSSTCTGGCATAWPPLAVSAGQMLSAAPGVSGTMLSTFTRADGVVQVSYNGQPLYYWQGDTKAGDVTGQGVNDFTVAAVSGAAPAASAPAASAPAASAPAPSASTSNSYSY